MLRFFRQLRKDQLMSDKSRKYLLYALGEILLVVIGILLALQINNWNTERLQYQDSINYHERILEDLDRFIRRTALMEENAMEVRSLIVQTVDLLESKELPEEKVPVFEKTIERYYQYSYRNPTLSTIQEMRNNGDFDLIFNIDLRNDLVELENHIQSIDEIYRSLGNTIQNNVKLVDRYVRSIPDTNSIDVQFRADFKAMAEDEDFINQFSRLGVHWRGTVMFSRRLNNMASDLKTAFVLELKEMN